VAAPSRATAAPNPSSFASNFTSSSSKFQSNTLYAAALANHLHGAGPGGGAQLTITFNSDIGSPGILGGEPFHYGTLYERDAGSSTNVEIYLVNYQLVMLMSAISMAGGGVVEKKTTKKARSFRTGPFYFNVSEFVGAVSRRRHRNSRTLAGGTRLC
jgi:hypothetical protein